MDGWVRLYTFAFRMEGHCSPAKVTCLIHRFAGSIPAGSEYSSFFPFSFV